MLLEIEWIMSCFYAFVRLFAGFLLRVFKRIKLERIFFVPFTRFIGFAKSCSFKSRLFWSPLWNETLLSNYWILGLSLDTTLDFN